MIPASNSGTDQAKNVTDCKFCNQQIRFDKNKVSKGGKLIPLNLDGTGHNCPARQRTPAAGATQRPAAQGVQELHDLTSKVAQDNKDLKAEVRTGFEHITQRLNSILNAVQSLLAEERQ